MAQFERFVAQTKGLTFEDYNAMWRWSIDDLDAFWNAIWDFFDIRASARPEKLLMKREMPNMKWGTGGRTNYVDNILKHSEGRETELALIMQSETFGRSDMAWGELRRQVASVAAHLSKMGVQEGDRVVAILPNTETALIAFLASASLGAVWSLCAPDMGHVVARQSR